MNGVGPTVAFSNVSTTAPAMRSLHKDSPTTLHFISQFNLQSRTTTTSTNLPTNFQLGSGCIMIASMVSWGASLINENTVYVNLFESYKNSLI